MNNATKQTARLARWYRSCAHGLFYFLIFTLPLIALPWTTDALEINKQTVLLLTSALAMIAWLSAMVVERQVRLRVHPWWWLIVGFLLAVIVSASLSSAPFVSWIGQSGQEYTSALTLVGLCVMMVIGAHTLSDTRVQRRVWSALFLSSALISICTLGPLISWQAPELIGTPYATGLYLTIMTILSASIWLVYEKAQQPSLLPSGWFGYVVQACMLITMVASTIVLLALDFWLFWVLIIVGTVILFVFALLRADAFSQTGRFVVPMALFVIAVLFLFIPTMVPNPYASELTISYGFAWDITKQTLAHESLLFGSGPGTFANDYALYHSTEINDSAVWDERFDRGPSHIMTMLTSFGLLPTLLYLLGIIWLAGISLMRLMRRSQPHDEWKMTFTTFSAWSMATAGQLFYASNVTLSFLFWLLTAILVSQVFLKEVSFPFARSSRVALTTTFGFVIANVLLLTMLFIASARYASDVSYAKASSLSQQGEEVDSLIAYVDHATQLNRWSDVYQRSLAQLFLTKTAHLVADDQTHPSQIQASIEASIASARRAVELDKSNAVNWALLGDIYREVAPLVSGADELSIAAYEQAMALAPANPKYAVAAARAYVVRADQLAILATSEDQAYANQAKQDRLAALASAIERLEHAVVLKDDYATAYYYLALAYERSGNVSEAIDRMMDLRDANPYDTGVALQLGLLYLRQGKVEEAKGEFERAVALSPTYANARWYLAAIYKQLGDTESALEQLRVILQTNPEHEVVLAEIERLESSLTVVEEIPEPLENIEVVEESEISTDQ